MYTYNTHVLHITVYVCVRVEHRSYTHLRISSCTALPLRTYTLHRRCLWGKPYRKAGVPRAIYILRPSGSGGRSGKHNEPPLTYTLVRLCSTALRDRRSFSTGQYIFLMVAGTQTYMYIYIYLYSGRRTYVCTAYIHVYTTPRGRYSARQIC